MEGDWGEGFAELTRAHVLGELFVVQFHVCFFHLSQHGHEELEVG